jgi:hypothetical protein
MIPGGLVVLGFIIAGGGIPNPSGRLRAGAGLVLGALLLAAYLAVSPTAPSEPVRARELPARSPAPGRVTGLVAYCGLVGAGPAVIARL